MPWQSFTVSYAGERSEGEVPSWMDKPYTIWFRCPCTILHNQISSRDFANEMDYAPQHVFTSENKHEYRNFMLGDWAWLQVDELGKDPANIGSTFCPVILGSDKTTVSVATGSNEYYPLYVLNGLVHNGAHHAHRDAVMVGAFLAIPKGMSSSTLPSYMSAKITNLADREHSGSKLFRTFRRQLFHASLECILSSLRPFMTEPEVVRCADGHFRRIIYGLGPYIADYPEQALLACIVQGWCPRLVGSQFYAPKP